VRMDGHILTVIIVISIWLELTFLLRNHRYNHRECCCNNYNNFFRNKCNTFSKKKDVKSLRGRKYVIRCSTHGPANCDSGLPYSFFDCYTLKSHRLKWTTVLLIAGTAGEEKTSTMCLVPVNGEEENPIRRLDTVDIKIYSLERPITLVDYFQANRNAQSTTDARRTSTANLCISF